MNTARKINTSAKCQLALLEALNGRLVTEVETEAVNAGFEITELVALSGLQDGHEVQRFLFILEGQRMVKPVPEGDLTSSVWKITDLGLEALKKFRGGLKAA